MRKKILFVVNRPEFLISHRLDICAKAVKVGYDVHIICPNRASTVELEALGFKVHILEFFADRANPFIGIFTIWNLIKFFKKINPDLVHLIAIKPYLFGGIAARVCRVPAVVSSVAGLGTLFSSESRSLKLRRALVSPLMKIALNNSNQKIIVQNNSDKDLLLRCGVKDDGRFDLIPGSGIKLRSCPNTDEPPGDPVVVMASRLLVDKGVREFVGASKLLKSRNVRATFVLVGGPDELNRGSIKRDELIEWTRLGLVDWLGVREDVLDIFSRSNIVVLPSFYGEGLPKVLIEAAACRRVVVTTDHPGCRDAIMPDVTGLLVPVRNSIALADALELLISQPEMRYHMGLAGRAMAEKRFDIDQVVERHMSIYEELIS